MRSWQSSLTGFWTTIPRSWKTSLIGFALGVMNLVAQGINWKTAVQSALIALLGAVAKDYNVSGTAASSKDVASK